MTIKIEIKERKAKISLCQKNKELDKLVFPEENNLSEKLLPAIDKLLKKNKLIPKNIRKILVSTDTPGSFTTSRIARAVAKAWNFARS